MIYRDGSQMFSARRKRPILESMEILVTRQPIFDRREELYGYDLVLRPSGVAANGNTPFPEQLVVNAFLGIGIDQVAADKWAFVTVDRNMLLGGAARLLPKERVVLQIAGRLGNDQNLIQACDQLASSGYRLSIATDRPREVPEDLLRVVDIVKINVSTVDRAMLSDMTSWLHGFEVRLLATQVRDRIERNICTNLGFDLFEGYRFAAPETLTQHDLPIQHVLAFRLLKLVRDPAATDSEIEDLFRRDVALSYKLLRMVNSGSGGGRDVWSIGHALRLLGRDRVARWLGLLLVTDGVKKSGVHTELMNLSLARARMCELLGDASGVPRARGPLFLIGMLSVLDQLLETPIEVLADSMELAHDIRVALLKREDYYGIVLALVEAYEQGRWESVDALAGSLGISTVSLAPLYLDALAWAAEHQRPGQEVTQLVGPQSGQPGSRGDWARRSQGVRLR
jgi:EAL and modified HD-GYP domain-containing signal transduction protein